MAITVHSVNGLTNISQLPIVLKIVKNHLVIFIASTKLYLESRKLEQLQFNVESTFLGLFITLTKSLYLSTNN